MKLNELERLAMNNPVRAAIQRYWETPKLRRLGGPLPGERVLEIGCGRGVGVECILAGFGAGRVEAFDLDPRMVDLARRRLARLGDRVRLWIGDAAAIDAPDGAYDAVFDFGILHHLPDWRRGVAEVARVLAPGGRFYCEEILIGFLDLRPIRRLFAHPREDRFDTVTFVCEMERAGLRLRATEELWGWAAWVVAEKPR